MVIPLLRGLLFLVGKIAHALEGLVKYITGNRIQTQNQTNSNFSLTTQRHGFLTLRNPIQGYIRGLDHRSGRSEICRRSVHQHGIMKFAAILVLVSLAAPQVCLQFYLQYTEIQIHELLLWPRFICRIIIPPCKNQLRMHIFIN